LSTILRAEPLQLKNRVRPVEIAFNIAHPEFHPSEIQEVDEDAAADFEEPESQNGQDPRSVQERVQNRTFVVSWKALLADPHWIKVSDIFNPNKTDWQLIITGAIKWGDANFVFPQLRRLRGHTLWPPL
jgi:hypothetical protein